MQVRGPRDGTTSGMGVPHRGRDPIAVTASGNHQSRPTDRNPRRRRPLLRLDDPGTGNNPTTTVNRGGSGGLGPPGQHGLKGPPAKLAEGQRAGLGGPQTGTMSVMSRIRRATSSYPAWRPLGSLIVLITGSAPSPSF